MYDRSFENSIRLGAYGKVLDILTVDMDLLRASMQHHLDGLRKYSPPFKESKNCIEYKNLCNSFNTEEIMLKTLGVMKNKIILLMNENNAS